MNWITGPNRAFGIGELKEQSAVIKVYSIAELKNALTAIYKLSGGVGTIQIAGDITITEPIRLKRYIDTQRGPTELIIQAIAGARIINANKQADQGYNWNQPGNTGIPVFDIGAIPTLDNPVIKYTFKDLTINSESAYPFGAFIAGDLGGITAGRWFSLVSMNNTKLYNVWNIFGAYDTAGAFNSAARLTLINPKITDLVFKNNPQFAMTGTYYNHPNIGCSGGYTSGIGVWSANDFSATDEKFLINNGQGVTDSIFINIYRATNIIVPFTVFGRGNTIINSYVTSTPPKTGFSYINCDLNLISNNTFFNVGSSTNTFGFGSGATFKEPVTFANIDRTAAEFNLLLTDTADSGAPGFYIGLNGLLANWSHYEIDWNITLMRTSDGAVNTYHIKSTFATDGSGNGTITGNSTIYANENFLTPTDIIPTWDNVNKILYIQTASSISNGVCAVKMTGIKLIAI